MELERSKHGLGGMTEAPGQKEIETVSFCELRSAQRVEVYRAVIISCHNLGLKAIEVGSLTVLESRNPRSAYQQVSFLLRFWGKCGLWCSPTFLWLLKILGVSWLTTTSLWCHKNETLHYTALMSTTLKLPESYCSTRQQWVYDLWKVTSSRRHC